MRTSAEDWLAGAQLMGAGGIGQYGLSRVRREASATFG